MFILILNQYLETVADIRILSFFYLMELILSLVDQLSLFLFSEMYSITVIAMHIKHGQDMYEQSQGAKSSAVRL